MNIQEIKQANGFTLIELLVVVLIIGILAAVALPQYQKAVDKSRAVSLMHILKAIKDAQEVYYLNNGTYTSNFDALEIELPAENFTTQSKWRRIREDGSGYEFYVDGPGGSHSVKGTPVGLAGIATIEFYYDHHPVASNMPEGSFRQCNSFSKRGEDVCQALGGVYKRTSASNEKIKFYALP